MKNKVSEMKDFVRVFVLKMEFEGKAFVEDGERVERTTSPAYFDVKRTDFNKLTKVVPNGAELVGVSMSIPQSSTRKRVPVAYVGYWVDDRLRTVNSIIHKKVRLKNEIEGGEVNG